MNEIYDNYDVNIKRVDAVRYFYLYHFGGLYVDLDFECIKNIPDQCSKIVIENSNNNQLKNDLEKKFQNLECYVMKDNLGYGKANNFGIKKSKTKYVFIINPDVILNEKNFNEILELLKNEKFTIAAPIEDISKIDFEKKKILEVEDVKGFAMIINTQNINAILFDENISFFC